MVFASPCKSNLYLLNPPWKLNTKPIDPNPGLVIKLTITATVLYVTCRLLRVSKQVLHGNLFALCPEYFLGLCTHVEKTYDGSEKGDDP